jgi:hypothetical protein
MIVEKGKYKGLKKEEIFEILKKEGFKRIIREATILITLMNFTQRM